MRVIPRGGSSPLPDTNMENINNIEVAGRVVNNIFEMTEGQVVDLRKEVDKFNHKVRVIVHPFYGVSDDQTDRTPAIIRLLKSRSDRRIPLFIFEEADKCSLYKQDLQNSEGSLNSTGIYLVPTVTGAPHPVAKSASGWELLVDVFNQVEVKDILLGGRYLKYQDLADGEAEYQRVFRKQLEKQGMILESSLGECVGIVAGKLVVSGFKVQLSNLCAPLGLSDFRGHRRRQGK